MLVIHTIKEIRELLASWRKEGKTIGFVPTMGYLHQGHFSLIEEASKQCHRVVVSIFVNPLQFGQGEDYEEYPRDLSRDANGAEEAGGQVIFAPSVAEMYPRGFKTFTEVEGITDKLCGASRPGHFRGVCTVVNKLLNIIQPEQAFFGQKDAQQVAVIKAMVRDLNLPVEIKVVPIVREADGLAMSSRNVYLSCEERKAALVLSKALAEAKQLILAGERNTGIIKKMMEKIIKQEEMVRIDYIAVCQGPDLLEEEELAAEGEALLALAAFLGNTRLIDNALVIFGSAS